MSSAKRKPRWTVVDRRSREDMRREAIEAARELLLNEGPDAITLMAVGEEVGRCHGTIAYHFGTSEELQTALMKSMVAELAEELDNTLSGPGQPSKNKAEHLANTIFDAFEEGGAGVLAAWIALSNRKRLLKPVREPVKRLVRRAGGQLVPGRRQSSRQTKDMLLFLMLCAMADSLIGPDICDMLGEGNGAMRKLALRLMPHFLKSNG